MLKRISINIILILLLVVIGAVIILSLLAQIQFEQAKKLELKYHWRKAETEYKTALQFNPFNAEYLAGAGDFLVLQSKYYKNKFAL